MSTPLASIIIPIAPYHQDVADYAIASARAQTIPAEIVTVLDYERNGTGWSRNEGVRQANGLFVVFLDADDVIEPGFIEETVKRWTPGRYVYTDDWQGDSLHQTPDHDAYLDGSWHTVTTLTPKAYIELIGGFDVNLPAIEDLDLYWNLMHNGICGVRCPKPLVHYSPHGQRSYQFWQRPDVETIKKRVKERYPMAKSCCGGAVKAPALPQEPEEGMILVQALYSGRKEWGHKPDGTTFLYNRPRGQHDYKMHVWPADADAHPELWQIIDMPPDKESIAALTPDVDTVMQLAQDALNDVE